jgi:hypothetical protein
MAKSYGYCVVWCCNFGLDEGRLMKKILRFFIVFIILLIFCNISYALDRCNEYRSDVRNSFSLRFNTNFPWWYGLAQLEQESSCRGNVTAFDAGMGIAQFMPATWKFITKEMGRADLNAYNPADSIEVQAFYMERIQGHENWTDRLWITFQIYNGGRSILYNEYKRAGIVDWDLMKQQCQRKKIQMKWGILDLCDVNYKYSKRIYNKAENYRLGKDHYSWRYW